MSGHWFSYSQSLNDTVEIKEVRINYDKTLSMTSVKKTNIDSSIIAEYYTRSLTDILSENSSVYIKSYGQGSLATSSVRGAGASHTIVTWNGIKINSPMPGQLDFSLIPASFIDEAEVFYGAGSIRDFSGALGGSVNLINKPDWNNRMRIKLSQDFGSYNTKKSQASIALGNMKFQSQTRLFYNSSDNDFEFLNSEISQDPVLQERKNASFTKGGIIQEFYIRPSSNHLLTTRFWYQSDERNIPEPIIVMPVEGNEKQKDHFLRSQLNWKYNKRRITVNTTFAWLYDYLNYKNHTANIDSENRTQSYTSRVDLTYDINSNLELSSGLSGNYTYVRTENYLNYADRKHFSAYFSAIKSIKQRLEINLMARQDLFNGKIVPLIPSAGIDYKLLKNADLHFMVNISRNYHKPTLNDQYWNPGGNPDLDEENGTIGEISLDYSGNSGEILSYNANVNIYRSEIKNRIQWQPGEHGYWEPVNLKNVFSKGIESFINFRVDFSKLKLSLRADYAYTSAKNIRKSVSSDMSVNKQLVYVPEHQANVHFKIKTGGFAARYYHRYTGRRYITSDNSQFLPSYQLGDITVSYIFKRNDHKAELEFSVKNVWDKNYQAVSYHPMPGRSYFISIRYLFKKAKAKAEDKVRYKN